MQFWLCIYKKCYITHFSKVRGCRKEELVKNKKNIMGIIYYVKKDVSPNIGNWEKERMKMCYKATEDSNPKIWDHIHRSGSIRKPWIFSL